MKIHHIGIIVKDINKNISIYEKLGYKTTTSVITDDIQSNKVVFLESMDSSQVIELVEAIDEKSSIYGFKEGYHHICYEIEEQNDFCEYFKELRIGKIFTKQIRAVAIDNRRVMFACLNNGMFIEFLL